MKALIIVARDIVNAQQTSPVLNLVHWAASSLQRTTQHQLSTELSGSCSILLHMQGKFPLCLSFLICKMGRVVDLLFWVM